MNERHNSEPLVSIIVPIYDVEKYLADCLESLTGQTYKNLEIICVNDGTPDKSEKIIDRYAARDKRVKKINQQNNGLNMARLTGFENSTGEYICFVDSDDSIHKKTIEVAVKDLLDTRSDIFVFSYKRFIKSKEDLKINADAPVKVLTTKEQILRYVLVNDPQYMHNQAQLTVWGKVYRRGVVEAVDWAAANYVPHEDLFWTPQAFIAANKVSVSGLELYFYRSDPTRNVLSRVTDSITLNGKAVGYLELVHNFGILIRDILKQSDEYGELEREFSDAMYGMYRGHMKDLVEKNALSTENNMDFIPEYYKYSEEHIRYLVSTIDTLDSHIKARTAQLDSANENLARAHEELDKLNGIKQSLYKLMSNIKRKAGSAVKADR